MERLDIFKDIAERTGGDIFVGIAGPMRSGKSTLAAKLAQLMVLPYVRDPYLRQRISDGLPVAGGGPTVVTTEPKYVPDRSIDITLDELTLKVQLIECVGYPVTGATGYEDADGPRLLRTPWADYDLPFAEAVEMGVRKVFGEYATVGLVVTTDGSVGDISRQGYETAEATAIEEVAGTGKPFVVVLNTTRPYAQATVDLAGELEKKYDAPVVPVDCQKMTPEDLFLILEQVLYEFPVTSVTINIPSWVEALDKDHWLRGRLEEVAANVAAGVRRLRDVDQAVEQLSAHDQFQEVVLKSMDLGAGVATVATSVRDDLFFQVLGDLAGVPVEAREDVIKVIRDMAHAKKEYDRVADGLREVRQTGYGVVVPGLEEMTFEEPELIRRGHQFGVRLRATAPSLHFIRADIETEVTPLIGTEKQSEELLRYLMEQFEDDPRRIWRSDLFGKSLHELLREGIQNKLYRMPEGVQAKLQETLSRIINEGSGGLICIII